MKKKIKKNIMCKVKKIIENEVYKSTSKCCSFILYQPPEPEIPESIIYKKNNKH